MLGNDNNIKMIIIIIVLTVNDNDNMINIIMRTESVKIKLGY